MSELSSRRTLLVRVVAVSVLVSGTTAAIPSMAGTSWRAWLGVVLAVIATLGASLALTAARVQLGAALLAASFAASLATSPTWFHHHRVLAALLLVVALVAPPDPRERALRAQMALVYFGAAVDKLSSRDWAEGRVLSALVAEVREHGAFWSPGQWISTLHPYPALYEALADAMPSGVLGRVAAALAIVLELGLALGWARGDRRLVLALAFALHGAIFLLTGSTFGVFLQLGLGTSMSLFASDVGSRARDLRVLAAIAFLSSPFARPELVPLAAWLALGGRRQQFEQGRELRAQRMIAADDRR